VLGLFETDHLAPRHRLHAIAEATYRRAFDIIRALRGIEVMVLGETTTAAAFLRAVSGMPERVLLLPYPAGTSRGGVCPPRPRAPGGRLRIGFVGATREDRGAHLVPGVIAACEGMAGGRVEWTVQLEPARLPLAADAALAADWARIMAMPNVRLLPMGLPSEEYYDALAVLDIVLLPYGERYAASGSGICCEALAGGLVQIVPEGSTLAAMIAEHGGTPVLFAERSPRALAEAVGRALRDHEALAADAATAARRWREHDRIGAFEESLRAAVARIGLPLVGAAA
jgi:glycosyltransferase involved in cell wall biosynthesis